MQTERGVPGYLLAINLLYTAGFLVMLGLGFRGLSYFIVGAVIFLTGTALTTLLNLKKHENLFNEITFLIVALFIANLVFYSSTEILFVFDLSFLIHGFLLLHFIYFIFRKGQLVRVIPGFPFFKLGGLFLGAILLSAIMAQHLKDVVYFFVINSFAFLIFYASYVLVRQNIIKRILETVFWFSFTSAVFAIWQLYSENYKDYYYPFLALRDQKILELWEVVSRVVGTWQHPSYLGIFLAIGLTVGTYLLYQANKSWKFTVLVPALSVVGATLLLTNTRSSVLAAGLGVLIFVFFEARRGKEQDFRGRRYRWVLLGAVAGLSLLLYQFVFVSEIYSKPQAWRVDTSATIWGRFLRADAMSTESLVQRSQLYELAIENFKRKPIFGIGAKNFPFEVEKIFETGTDAHNLVLQTAAETGVLGLASFLFLYLYLLKKIILEFRSNFGKPDYQYQSALVAVILILFFDSMFNNPLYSLRILALFWFFAAFMLIEESQGKIITA